MRPRPNNPLPMWVQIALIAIVLLGALAIILFANALEANAEWITVPGFGGMDGSASLYATTIPWANTQNVPNAGNVSDWLWEGNTLRRWSWAWRNCKRVDNSTGINFIAPTTNPNRILIRAAGLYDMVLDTMLQVTTDTLNTVQIYASDSIVHNTIVTAGNRRWLELTLTNVRSVALTNGLFRIAGFYSDTTCRLLGTATATATDTMFLPLLSINPAATLVDAAVAKDTTWFVDGSFLSFLPDSIDLAHPTISYPTYLETGDLDSLKRRGDSLLLYANFTGTYPTNGVWGTGIVLGDQWNNFGQPMFVRNHLTTGGERLLMLTDSARYAGLADDTPVTGVSFVAFNGNFFSGARPNVEIATYSGDYDYQAKYGDVIMAVFTPDDQSGFNYGRQWDCGLYRALGCGQSSVVWVCRLYKDGSTYRIRMWARDIAGDWETDRENVPLTVHQMVPYAVQNTSGVTNEYTLIELHRGTMWYGGSTVNENKIAPSYLLNYDSISTTGQILDGDDPVTGLFSIGDNLVIARRHGMEYVSGTAQSNFSFGKFPTEIGMVRNTGAIDPVSKSLYGFSSEGFFRANGASVELIPTLTDKIIRDSINWDREAEFSGKIFNGYYILTCYFGGRDTGPGTILATHRVMIALELATNRVSLLYHPTASRLFTATPSVGRNRLFLGDNDSTMIWEAEPIDRLDELRSLTTAMFVYTSNWRSGWDAFGDRTEIKRVNSYRFTYETPWYLEYDSGNPPTDTVIVEFFAEEKAANVLTLTPTWADTISLPNTASMTGSAEAIERAVSNAVWGTNLAFAIKSPSTRIRIVDFAVDVERAGRKRKR